MADITLTLDGDASGAAAALDDVGKSTEDLSKEQQKLEAATKKAWDKMLAGAAAAAAAVAAFSVASMKAYADSERVQRQLTRAAGEYADALSDQAEALSRKYAVDDDIIKQSQVLLTQWGGVGAATEDVTRAVLNYASATGQDAVGATQDLIRNVESGGAGLAKMGVHFEATGNRGKDLAGAVEALNKKFGGAAEADAGSLSGSVHAAMLAFEDFQKSFGGALADIMRQSGVIPALTEKIRELTNAVFTPKTAGTRSESEVRAELMQWEQVASGTLEVFKDLERTQRVTFEEAQGHISRLTALLPKDSRAQNLTYKGASALDEETNKARKEREAADKEAQTKAAAHAKKMEEIEKKNLEEFKKFQKEWDEVDLRSQEAQEKASMEMLKRIEDTSFDVWDTIADNEKKSADKLAEAFSKVSDDTTKYIRDQQQAWADAGAAIGSALVNSISNQLERLASGEDLDAGEAIANVVGDVLAVAGQVIGAVVGGIYGGPNGTQIGGAIGGAVGGLAGSGVKALGRAGKSKKYHSGGWVGDEAELPRYHSGAWIGPDEQRAVLQTGERVLSRAEVSRAGGPDAVDAMAGGVPRFSISIQTMDSMGVRQFFENQGGRGFYNALRTGRGSLRPAFGGG